MPQYTLCITVFCQLGCIYRQILSILIRDRSNRGGGGIKIKQARNFRVQVIPNYVPHVSSSSLVPLGFSNTQFSSSKGHQMMVKDIVEYQTNMEYHLFIIALFNHCVEMRVTKCKHTVYTVGKMLKIIIALVQAGHRSKDQLTISV